MTELAKLRKVLTAFAKRQPEALRPSLLNLSENLRRLDGEEDEGEIEALRRIMSENLKSYELAKGQSR